MSQQVFISYTTREHEVKEVTPLIKALVRELERLDEWHGVKRGFNKYFWFDRAQLQEKVYWDVELQHRLGSAIDSSRKMLAFVSPCYWPSRWCRFEWCTGQIRALPALPIVWKGTGGALMYYGDPIYNSHISDFFPPAERLQVLDEREFALSPEDYLRSRRFPELARHVHSFVMSGL